MNPIFNVNVSKKTNNHMFYNRGSKLGYKINEIQGATILLDWDETYTFNINSLGHPFYFTTSEIGNNNFIGNVMINSNQITDMGVIEITPHNDFFEKPDYYQCGIHPYMGGKVVWVNQDMREEENNTFDKFEDILNNINDEGDKNKIVNVLRSGIYH
jgi:hypothetical protein